MGGLTITGELLVPAAAFRDRLPDAVERALETVGVLPSAAREKRWRMDAEYGGGAYRLTFTYTLPLGVEELPHAQS